MTTSVAAILFTAAITPGPNNFVVMDTAARSRLAAAAAPIAGIVLGTLALFSPSGSTWMCSLPAHTGLSLPPDRPLAASALSETGERRDSGTVRAFEAHAEVSLRVRRGPGRWTDTRLMHVHPCPQSNWGTEATQIWLSSDWIHKR